MEEELLKEILSKMQIIQWELSLLLCILLSAAVGAWMGTRRLNKHE